MSDVTASRSHADLVIYLGRSAAARGRDVVVEWS